MMGGEFCGNATRSLAFMLVKRKNKKIQIKDKKAEFYLSVSGTNQLLKAEVFLNKKQNPVSVKVEIPIYNELNSICQKDKEEIVKMEGITHVVVDENKESFDENNFKEKFIQIRERNSLNNNKAVGVLWKKELENEVVMKPVVWVKETNSYFYETSCGSGTAALALSLAAKNNKQLQEFKILQPSGEYIIAVVKRSKKEFIKVYIKGVIKIIAEGTCWVYKT